MECQKHEYRKAQHNENETHCLHIDILGITSFTWSEIRYLLSEYRNVYCYSGQKKSTLLGYNTEKYRIISIKFCGQPFNIMIIHVQLQLLMQKRGLLSFMVKFNLKLSQYASKMSCLQLECKSWKSKKAKMQLDYIKLNRRAIYQFLNFFFDVYINGCNQVEYTIIILDYIIGSKRWKCSITTTKIWLCASSEKHYKLLILKFQVNLKWKTKANKFP